jgi:hypothetical protein
MPDSFLHERSDFKALVAFRPWSLLLSNLKLRSRSLGAMMDLMCNRANFALTDSV